MELPNVRKGVSESQARHIFTPKKPEPPEKLDYLMIGILSGWNIYIPVYWNAIIRFAKILYQAQEWALQSNIVFTMKREENAPTIRIIFHQSIFLHILKYSTTKKIFLMRLQMN